MKMKKLVFKIITIVFLGVLLIWFISESFQWPGIEYTNNAQVRQQVLPVHSRIQGYIRKIYFTDFQHVKKGDTLLVIDDSELQLQREKAFGSYMKALAEQRTMEAVVKTAESNIAVSDAVAEEARIQLAYNKTDMQRYTELISQNAVTSQQYETVKTTYESSLVRYRQLKQQCNSTKMIFLEQSARTAQVESEVSIAKSALDLADLNLSYTVIVSPVDGETGRKEIETGQLIQYGQLVVNIIKEKDLWVSANFRESQISGLYVGQPVDIHVDAYGDIEYKGIVESVSMATGTIFSLLPQDYSSGNFVKIEQRIPVKIRFSESNSQSNLDKLKAGMNVECKIHRK